MEQSIPISVMIRWITRVVCIVVLIFKSAALLWGADSIFNLFVVGVLFWNAIPISLVLFWTRKCATRAVEVVKFLAAIGIAFFAIQSTGCYLMWWCEPDGQLALIWLVLPGLELLVGGIIVAVGLGVSYLRYKS